MKNIYEKGLKWWHSYRYRFIPWVIYSWKARSVRHVPSGTADRRLSDIQVENSLLQLFTTLEQSHSGRAVATVLDKSNTMSVVKKEEKKLLSKSRDLYYHGKIKSLGDNLSAESSLHHRNLDIMQKQLGFTVERKPSQIKGGGTGVFVTSGTIPPDTVVALYPGVVYNPGEPILLQSFGNAFIFHCIDGIHIDGNDRFISRTIFRSCSHRDKIGLQFMSDMSWLTPHPVNPLAIGQYVNNSTSEKPANVCYQEFDFPETFPVKLRQLIPNVNFSVPSNGISCIRSMRTVALVSLRTIATGEELLSSYFTVVLK